MLEKFLNFIRQFQEDKITSLLGFLIFVCPLAFSYYLYENYETPKYFLWLSLIGWSLVVFSLKTKFLFNKKLLYYFLISMGLALVSTVLSSDIMTSFFGSYYRFTSGLVFYVSWSVFVLILFNNLTEDKKTFLYKILSLGAFFVAVLGILQSFGIIYYVGIESAGIFRAPSFLGNPNFSSMFMVMVLPLTIRLVLSAKNFWTRIFYSLNIFFVIISLFLMASRGAVLAFVVSLIFFIFYFFYKNKINQGFIKTLVSVGLVVVLFIGVVSVVRPDAFFNVLSKPDINVTLRLKLWKTAGSGIIKQPFFGEGPGVFNNFFERNRNIDFANEEGIFDDAHNIFVQMTATTGLPFALLFVGLLLFAIINGHKNIESSVWVPAEISSVVAFVIAGSFNPVTIACFMVLGLVVAGLLGLGATKKDEVVFSRCYKYSGVFIGILLIYMGTALILSELMSAYAYRAYFKNKYTISRQILLVAKNMNPSFFMYELYFIGNEIQLGQDIKKINTDIDKYIQRKKSSARTYVQGANLYYMLYRKTNNTIFIKKAIETYSTALTLDPFFGERYGQMGIYYYILSDFSSAKKYVEFSLKLKPNHIPSLILYAKICEQLGLNKEGIQAIESAYKLSPENFQLRAWNYRAKYYKDLKKVGLDVNIYEGKLE